MNVPAESVALPSVYKTLRTDPGSFATTSANRNAVDSARFTEANSGRRRFAERCRGAVAAGDSGKGQHSDQGDDGETDRE